MTISRSSQPSERRDYTEESMYSLSVTFMMQLVVEGWPCLVQSATSHQEGMNAEYDLNMTNRPSASSLLLVSMSPARLFSTQSIVINLATLPHSPALRNAEVHFVWPSS